MWSRNCFPFRSTYVHPRNGVSVARSSVLCPVLCRSLYVLLSFFFWPLYCLFFFDLRLRVYPSRIFKLLVYCVDHCYFVFLLFYFGHCIVCSSIFNFFLSCVNILCLTKTYGWSRLLVCVWPMCYSIVSLAWCSHDTIARNQISSDVGNLLSSNYICTHNYYTIVLADNFQPIVYTFSATCN